MVRTVLVTSLHMYQYAPGLCHEFKSNLNSSCAVEAWTNPFLHVLRILYSQCYLLMLMVYWMTVNKIQQKNEFAEFVPLNL